MAYRRKSRKPRIIAMVPAKLGSTRLAMKNLALIDGKPLIYYAITAAKNSEAFDKVVVNAEDVLFETIAKRYGVGFYHRPAEIVSPTTKTDTVVYDFLLKNPCDIVAWVSPIAPLQTPGEVKDVVDYFLKEGLDSLMTVKEEKVHCVCGDKPVNFKADEIFAQTQDLMPVRLFVYSVMMWRSDTFIRTFEAKGHALLSGKIGFYPVSRSASIIIKREEDLMLADYISRSLSRKRAYKTRYDALVKKAAR